MPLALAPLPDTCNWKVSSDSTRLSSMLGTRTLKPAAPGGTVTVVPVERRKVHSAIEGDLQTGTREVLTGDRRTIAQLQLHSRWLRRGTAQRHVESERIALIGLGRADRHNFWCRIIFTNGADTLSGRTIGAGLQCKSLIAFMNRVFKTGDPQLESGDSRREPTPNCPTPLKSSLPPSNDTCRPEFE